MPSPSKTHAEQELCLTFRVKVKTFGHRGRTKAEVGSRLAKICGLNFNDVEVWDDKGRYEWTPTSHDGRAEYVASGR